MSSIAVADAERENSMAAELNNAGSPGPDHPKPRPEYRKKVVDFLSDLRWHTREQICEDLRRAFPQARVGTVGNVLKKLRRFPHHGHELQQERVGSCFRYRLRKLAVSYSHVPATKLTDFMDEFPNLLRQLEDWTSKGQYEIVPSSLQGIAVKMKRLFEALKKSISA